MALTISYRKWQGRAMDEIISSADKLACVERELKMRQHVYERLVADGRLSAGKAAHEIACMAAIVRDYIEAEKKERLL
jgi:hypothetical protein